MNVHFQRMAFMVVLAFSVLSAFPVYADDSIATPATSESAQLLGDEMASGFSDSSGIVIGKMHGYLDDLKALDDFSFPLFITDATSWFPASYWMVFELVIINGIILSLYQSFRR